MLISDAKDLMVAVLGGGVALGGLLLIFSGFLFSQAAMMPSSTADEILNNYKKFARLGLLPFAGSLAVAALSALYFLYQFCILADVVLIMFLLLIVATIFYGFAATKFL